MKTTNFLRTIATASMFAVTGVAAFAWTNTQIATLPTYDALKITAVTVTDNATVGAVMPFTTLDRAGNITTAGAAFMASAFEWKSSGVAAVTNFVALNAANAWATPYAVGAALTPAVGANIGGTYVTDYQIQATMPALAGAAEISLTEQARLADGTGASCFGITQKIAINIIGLPTMDIPNNPPLTSCGPVTVLAPFKVLVSFTTQDASATNMYVTYQITAKKLDLTPLGSAQNFAVNVVKGTTFLEIHQDQLDAVSGGTNVVGEYTVAITGVWDNVSYRGMNRTALNVTPTTNTSVKLYTLPLPATAPINHLIP